MSSLRKDWIRLSTRCFRLSKIWGSLAKYSFFETDSRAQTAQRNYSSTQRRWVLQERVDAHEASSPTREGVSAVVGQTSELTDRATQSKATQARTGNAIDYCSAEDPLGTTLERTVRRNPLSLGTKKQENGTAVWNDEGGHCQRREKDFLGTRTQDQKRDDN